MLTPQELTKKEFDKAVIGGYVMASVDEFLTQLGQDYAALYKENAILKNKLKVLVDKVEEYRSTEDAMRMALLSANKTAREINDEAEEQKKRILAEAESAAEQRRQQLLAGLASEEAALQTAKRNTAEYVDKLRAAVDEYVRGLNRIYDFVEPVKTQTYVTPAEQPVIKDDIVELTAKSIEDSLAKIMEQNISSSDDERETVDDTKPYQPGSAAELKSERIDLNNLKFGSNYAKAK